MPVTWHLVIYAMHIFFNMHIISYQPQQSVHMILKHPGSSVQHVTLMILGQSIAFQATSVNTKTKVIRYHTKVPE